MLVQIEGEEVSRDVFSRLWQIKIPNKIAFVIWRALRNWPPTKDNLRSRSVLEENSDFLCSLCHSCNESADHLFTSCEVARQVWLHCYSWTSPTLAVVLHGNIEGLFWQVIWCAVIYCIWKQRNNSMFNHTVVNSKSLLEEVKLFSWSWLNGKLSGFDFSFVQWTYNPSACIRGG